MHKLHNLKEMLCDQLEEYADKELTAGSLDVVDKLAHTIKNLDKIIDKYEGKEEYSGTYYMDDDPMRGGSYARGRRNVRRDNMGRYSGERGYSRNDGMIAELHELMNDAPDDKTRMEINKLIQKMEQM